jgi:hypothetical protein
MTKRAFSSPCLWVAAVVLSAASSLLAHPPIVFVSRYMGSSPDSTDRVSAIERALSGRLLLREADGRLRVLVDSSQAAAGPEVPADVTDPDVSWDGGRIVFAGYSRAESAWRIYEIQADGSGLRQVTRSDRDIDLSRYGPAAEVFATYDDVDPCYLPDGRICFVSTRYPGIAPDSRRRATNLYVVNPDGTDVHRITSERFGADTPAVHPTTGQIVYSRWWRTPLFTNASSPVPPLGDPAGNPDGGGDVVPPGSPGYEDVNPPPPTAEPLPPVRSLTDDQFPGLNSWFLAHINPDGSGMSMFSGFGLDREETQAHRPSFTRDGAALALFIPRTPFLGLPRGDGLRLFRPGPVLPEHLGGPQTFAGGERFQFVYASAEALDDGLLLVTAASRDSLTDYDVYLQDPSTSSLTLLHRNHGTSELHAVPLAARPRPPVIADRFTGRRSDLAPVDVADAYASGGRFTFRVDNIFANAPVDVGIATAPPMGHGLSIQFWTNFQRTSVDTPDEPILIHEEPIPPDGHVEVELPAGIPLFEVLRTRDGEIAMGRDGQIFHVGGLNFGTAATRAESGSCVGCHAGHSMMEVPEDPSWTNIAPSADVRASTTLFLQNSQGTAQFLRPENLVDRSTAPIAGEWAAQGMTASATLSWNLPVEGREVVIYGPRTGQGALGQRSVEVHSLVVTTFLDGRQQERISVNRPISPEGTRVALRPEGAFNRLDVLIPQGGAVGLFEGQPSVALAEIELIGRAVGAGVPPSFRRGDTNCDSVHNLTDAVVVLGHLFAGAPQTLCCEAGADIDRDGALRLTDAVFLLDHLFLAGAAPPAPFPECGAAPTGGLSCAQRECP